MTIRWYPGHMDKALQKIAELIRTVDVVIEILDARLPLSSSNHQLQELRRTKPWIKVLNKHDLADPAVTKSWVRFFEAEKGVRALPLSARQFREANQLTKLCKQLAPSRAKPGRPLRAMVVGIPNVGKSTLINTLAGKSLAKVGDKPAITINTQQIDLRNGIILTDTPGVLWPDMSDQTAAYRLAVSGAIGAGALDYATVGMFAASFMLERYPAEVKGRYKLDPLPADSTALIEEIGRRLGCLMAGGVVDQNRAAEAFLRELRAAKIGRISLEAPHDFPLTDSDSEEPSAGPIALANPGTGSSTEIPK